MKPKRLRCAIYTRKSSEEGLEQSFNSLDAQREACAAYVKSQAHEGWVLLPNAYDDGGYSGGSMERPGLKALLADIASGFIDIIVVYKVDRLTRSLTDFSRIIAVLDEQEVSFVSVTQQFSTTTSMGRLTLNMLLSFAQFEREVTAERIRDKIAASKRKGLWMGGNVPLGYDADGRTLKVNEGEAEIVRQINRLYLELGCVRRLAEAAKDTGLLGKVRNGIVPPPFSRGHLYRILSNPIYIGRISHKGEIHDGLHSAIIDQATWDAVQAQLAANRQSKQRRANAASPSLLAGRIVDATGAMLTPSHASKNGRRYRYYVSQGLISGKSNAGLRLPASEIEELALRTLGRLLSDERRLFDELDLGGLPVDESRRVLDRARDIADRINGEEKLALMQDLIERIAISEEEVIVTIALGQFRERLGMTAGSGVTEIRIPAKLRRLGMASRLVVGGEHASAAKPDDKMVRLIVKANDWLDRLTSGRAKSIGDIAEAEAVTPSYVSRIIQLALLSPRIADAILDGRQPVELTADRLIRQVPLPMAWDEQERLLGIG